VFKLVDGCIGSPRVFQILEEVPAPDWVQQLLTERKFNPLRVFP